LISQLHAPEVGAPLASVANCGASLAGNGASTAPAGRVPSAVDTAFNGLAITLSGSALTTSYSPCGRAKRSRFLNSSQASCLSPGLAMRTSSHSPNSLWPCSAKTSLPSFSPWRGSTVGSQLPLSQMMTVPAPYCFGGIVPSKLLYDSG